MSPSPLHGGERFARANGVDLCHDTFGSAGDPAMLLIMGLGTQMVAWPEPFCEGLAARGFHVVRFDNRDVGRSTQISAAGVPDIAAMMMQALQGKAPAAPYTLADMADDGVGLLDALGIDRAHVVGASMGGAIAQELALRHPDRVLTLTSIMSTSGDPSLPPPKPEAMAILMTPSPTEHDRYLERYLKMIRVLRGPGFPEDEAADVERAERAFSRGIHPAGTARQLAAILASGSRRERLKALRVPTLVIHGREDPLVPYACGLDVAAAVPAATMVTVERMRHALPTVVWPELIDAIAKHAGHR